MSEQIPSQPAWEDITLEEIQAMIADDRVKDALSLARLRLDGVKRVPDELRAAIAEMGAVSQHNWEAEIVRFETEILVLQQIIQTYNQ